MRRGHGIAGLTQAAKVKEQYTRTGEEVKAASMAAMREQMGTFKRNLETFAAKYKADIRKDPAFRAQFQTMCANIGVDPLASNKGAWAELLGFGDFYYELGVQIVEACWATRGHNGGLMELPALLRYVNRRRGSAMDPISEDDVTRAIKKLRVLGSGFDVVKIGFTTYVRSVPGELNMDKNRVLEIAQEAEGGLGCLSREALIKASGWTVMRADEALQGLLREGLAMIDDGAADRVRLYWFPCVGKNQG